MCHTEKKESHWLDIFANFRNGAFLTEIIREAEPFIREPKWISPVHDDQYRRYHTYDLKEIRRGEGPFLDGEGPLWDGICKDESSRKILFVRELSSPSQICGDGGELSSEEKAAMEKVFRQLNCEGDLESWFHEYYPLASELTHVGLVGDPFNSLLERGYRCELILLNLIDDYLGTPTSGEDWDEFYKTMNSKMFGERGLPYVIFPIAFQI